MPLDKPGAEGGDDGVVADEKNEEEEKALSKCGEEREARGVRREEQTGRTRRANREAV